MCHYRLFLLGCVLTASMGDASAVTISFDYTYDGGFFSGDNFSRRATLEAAGSYFSDRLQDTLSAIDSSGTNQFNAQFLRPDTGATETLSAFDVASDTLTIFVGARDLGTSTLGQGGPGGFSVSGTQAFVEQAAYRGEPGAQADPATDFAPWGGAVTFDADAAWYFDADPASSESFSGFDFFSVALHELGHVLGIGTSNSWSRWIVGGVFTGLESKLANGGADILLSSDGGHWQVGQTSPVNGQGSVEAAMSPSIASSTRKNFTDLDLAALKDVGWEVAAPPPATAVPLPSYALLVFALVLGALGQGLLARRGATFSA